MSSWPQHLQLPPQRALAALRSAPIPCGCMQLSSHNRLHSCKRLFCTALAHSPCLFARLHMRDSQADTTLEVRWPYTLVAARRAG